MTDPPESVSEVIDAWLASLDDKLVAQRLQFLEKRRDELRTRIDALASEFQALAEEIARAQEVLALKARFTLASDGSPAQSSQASLLAGQAAPRRRGKDAVLTIMGAAAPDREWTAKEMLQEMIARGWSTGPSDYHGVQVAMSRLAREHKIDRPRYGIYKLKAAVPTNVHGQDGDEPKGSGDPRVVAEDPTLALEGARRVEHGAGS